jgi:hypothetical protein
MCRPFAYNLHGDLSAPLFPSAPPPFLRPSSKGPGPPTSEAWTQSSSQHNEYLGLLPTLGPSPDGLGGLWAPGLGTTSKPSVPPGAWPSGPSLLSLVSIHLALTDQALGILCVS